MKTANTIVYFPVGKFITVFNREAFLNLACWHFFKTANTLVYFGVGTSKFENRG